MITHIDIAVIVIYIVGIVLLGCWAGLRKQSNASSGDYFLAGKSLSWPAIGLALFATNISCVHLISLAQSGFDTGLLNGNFEWMAAFVLILLALFFIPFYIRSGITTLPDFLEKRYNRACRDWLMVLSVVSAVIVHIGFSFLTGGLVIEALFGIDIYTSIVVIAVLTALYTIIGGLTAVVLTESIQTIVLLAGAIIITVIAWNKIGGWSSITDILQTSHAMDKLSMLRPAGDSSGMPWYAVFLGYPVLGIWYWCADQTIVQRVLGAKDENHARVGALFCGFLKILPVFIFVLPGLIAYVLVENGQLDISSLIINDKNGAESINSKNIYTVMITQLLPTGLTGIVVAAMLAALMSTVSGALNSISTLISFDLFKRIKPEISDKKLVFIGRVAAGITLIFAIALVPLLNSYESLFIGLNDIIAHIAPPITTVFLLGVFWGKASAKAAQYTLWIGSFLGVLVFGMNKLYPATASAQIPFMMMSFYLFCICVLIQISLSYIYPSKQIALKSVLYWKSPLEPLRSKGWPGLGNYRLLSLLLLGCMAALYWFFR